jgi:hypothetical protein
MLRLHEWRGDSGIEHQTMCGIDVLVPDIRVCCGRGWHRTSCRTTFSLPWVGWDLVRI